jgi:hypothetical protein
MPMRVQEIKNQRTNNDKNPNHSFNENKNKEQTNIVFSSA